MAGMRGRNKDNMTRKTRIIKSFSKSELTVLRRQLIMRNFYPVDKVVVGFDIDTELSAIMFLKGKDQLEMVIFSKYNIYDHKSLQKQLNKFFTGGKQNGK